METTIISIYFCGISQRYHLDNARLVQFMKSLGNKAKVDGKWQEKHAIYNRTILGSNLGTFRTYCEALEYSVKAFSRSPIDYTPIKNSGLTVWVAVNE